MMNEITDREKLPPIRVEFRDPLPSRVRDAVVFSEPAAVLHGIDGEQSRRTESLQNRIEYELGMDFLSMANVYNSTPAGDYKTAEDVYAAWWKLYMQRWNYLMPEVPLYSNEYYDLYNAQIKGVVEHPTNPYWGPSDALID